MPSKNEINVINFSKDLDLTSESLFKKEKIELTSFNDIIQEKKEGREIDSVKSSEEESFVRIFLREIMDILMIKEYL